MNRRSFLLSLGAGLVAATDLWLPSTRTVIDLNPQGLPVDDDLLRWSGPDRYLTVSDLPYTLASGVRIVPRTEPFNGLNAVWADVGGGISLPSTQVMIDGVTVASFAGSDSLSQAMAYLNTYSKPFVLRVHAPEHAPLRMPDERVKGVL